MCTTRLTHHLPKPQRQRHPSSHLEGGEGQVLGPLLQRQLLAWASHWHVGQHLVGLGGLGVLPARGVEARQCHHARDLPRLQAPDLGGVGDARQAATADEVRLQPRRIGGDQLPDSPVFGFCGCAV